MLATEPPPGATAGGRCFVVGDGGVALRDAGPGDDGALYLGSIDGVACWAVDAVDAGGLAGAVGLRDLYAQVDRPVWAMAGRAVQLVEWARTTRFCGRCGTATEAVPGERARRCPACGLLAFPRLAPAVIVLIERDDRMLLARGRGFPTRMYSCLAGFVEPGETLEEAVHREVAEEVGVDVADVRYFGSQPWPFPHSLMIGFTARWAGGELTPDGTEIVDAGWFGVDDLPPLPSRLSIARALVDAWLAARGVRP
ncbi:MAG TPA: NAD(+) diphosphatase [Acidimicrobiales bacterium]